ncbi:MAG TPA: D-lyxose/D-mannose family sugar isomerase [Candidatus Hydrogenedentes bacterium]|nr:D-lyxose/D-mannose family sugar isomerase [Candidatus Hydrogenedentota bacterium]
MKRSEINALIEHAKTFFAEHRFMLPPWAFWGPSDWKGKRETCAEIVENMLGWDITDFGSGDFDACGLLLFTIRNGNPARDKKPYAEKIMIVREEQETPMHFHWSKMEDIINRGGGNLVIELSQSTPDEQFCDRPFSVTTDGIAHRVEPGGKVVLTPGESICLTQGLYHRFYGEKGKGLVLVGEVSQVNDDRTDNRFYAPIGRFPVVEEDVAPNHLLVGDYPRFL